MRISQTPAAIADAYSEGYAIGRRRTPKKVAGVTRVYYDQYCLVRLEEFNADHTALHRIQRLEAAHFGLYHAETGHPNVTTAPDEVTS